MKFGKTNSQRKKQSKKHHLTNSPERRTRACLRGISEGMARKEAYDGDFHCIMPHSGEAGRSFPDRAFGFEGQNPRARFGRLTDHEGDLRRGLLAYRSAVVF